MWKELEQKTYKLKAVWIFFFKCQQHLKHFKRKGYLDSENKKTDKENPRLTGNDRVWRRLQPISTCSSHSGVFCAVQRLGVCDVVYQTFRREVFLQLRPTLRPPLNLFFVFFASFYSTTTSTSSYFFHVLTWQQMYVISVTSDQSCALNLKEKSFILTWRVSVWCRR